MSAIFSVIPNAVRRSEGSRPLRSDVATRSLFPYDSTRDDKEQSAFFWVTEWKILFTALLFFTFGSSTSAMEVKPPTLDLSARQGGSSQVVFLLRNTEAVTETYIFTIQGFKASDEDGRQIFLPASETSGLPSWLYLNRATVTLKPGESAPVVVQFRPTKEAAPGAYQAVVFATHVRDRRDEGVVLGSRVGVLVFATVEGELKHDVRIASFRRVSSEWVDRLPISFEAVIENKGTAHEIPRGHVVVTNVFGRLTTTLDLQAHETPLRILPNSSRRFEMRWGDERDCRQGFFGALRCEWRPFLIGRYRAQLVLDGSTDTLPSEKVSFFVVPWRTLILALFVSGLFVVGWRLRKS